MPHSPFKERASLIKIDCVPVGSFSQGAYVFIDNTDSNLHNTKDNISLIATLIRVFSGKKLK